MDLIKTKTERWYLIDDNKRVFDTSSAQGMWDYIVNNVPCPDKDDLLWILLPEVK